MLSLLCTKTKCKSNFFPSDVVRQMFQWWEKLVFYLLCRFLCPSRVLFFSNRRAHFYQNRYGWWYWNKCINIHEGNERGMKYSYAGPRPIFTVRLIEIVLVYFHWKSILWKTVKNSAFLSFMINCRKLGIS